MLKRNYLVFTSAGDNAHLSSWLRGSRNFDLWITYYGNQPGRYRDLADFYTERKDAKFPNLHHLHQTQPDFLKRYHAIMVIDDDILIRGVDICRLFKVLEERDLWLLQPAYDRRGKTSHRITRRDLTCSMRYTNFVEMACPIFRGDKLISFLDVFDPALLGFGTDYWFVHHLGPDIEGRIAIIDDIPCVNPHDYTKQNYRREIDANLPPIACRRAIWEEISARLGITFNTENTKVFSSVKKTRLQYLIRLLTEKIRRPVYRLWTRRHKLASIAGFSD